MIRDTSDFLEHFGVKGMKWGVRKSGPKDVTLTKGTKILNVSQDKPREIDGPIYSAHLKRDIVNYRGPYAQDLKLFKGADKIFSNSFTVKKNINAAGKDAQLNAFKGLWESDQEGVAKALAESYKDMKFGAAFNAKILKLDRTDTYQQRIIKSGQAHVDGKAFQDFAASVAIDHAKRDPYFKALSDRGYNALVDLNDVKEYGSKEPLLIFKPKQTLGKRNTIELTEEHVSRAIQAYSNQKILDSYVDNLHD